MTMPQNLIFQNLPNLCRLEADSHGFVNLVPMTSDEIQQAGLPVPCDPGAIIDAIAAAESNKKYKGRNLVGEYTEYTKPWRNPETGAAPYQNGFFGAAEQWLKDNGIDFQVFTNPVVNVYQVCTHIDPTGRQIDGNIRYLIEINGMPLYTRRYGKLPDGKQNEHFHLEEMYQSGLLERPTEGHVHKTNALGVQCARLNLSAIQNLMASQKEPTSASIS